ncbi:sugar transferase [Tundrisphaera sp. TA3]|uniref:sugar transferase n=1 Tax=Tundrisphaera sp. TA3 TaxID=3435775 RepID=UPI003EBDCAA5
MNNLPGEAPATPDHPAGGRLLIVGDRRAGRRVARCFCEGSWSGHTVVGFIDAGHDGYAGRKGGRQLAVHPQAEPVRVLGQVDRLADWVERVRATDLVVALSGRPASRVRPAIDRIGRRDLRVHWISEVPSARPGESRAPASVREPGSWRVDRLAKRMVDVLASALGLVLLSPLFALASALILLSTGRPIFYTQERVGQGGKTFRIIKFRSMRLDAEGSTGPIWASNGDDRCTRVGAWLRRTNIDELPQLVNVLKGEMSLVGPRPERPIFVDQFTEAMPDYDLRHAVPGGMTGWAQVHGWRGRTSLRKRVQYDLNYIQNWSFWFDFKVLYMTVQHVACKKTTWPAPKKKPRRPGR